MPITATIVTRIVVLSAPDESDVPANALLHDGTPLLHDGAYLLNTE